MDDRQIDCLVMEKVFGYRVVEKKLDWYRVPVFFFYASNSDVPEYTYDSNACNAMIYRNGRDDSDGTVPPLPFFMCDAEGREWQIVKEMASKHNLELSMTFSGGKFTASFGKPVEHKEAASAICLAALLALGLMPQ